MLVIGIDPSLSCTAVCVGGSEKDFTIETFSDKNPAYTVAGRMKRYSRLSKSVHDYIKQQQIDREDAVGLIVIENYAFNSKYNSEVMAELGCTLRHWLTRLGPVVEVAITTVKKFATGKGTGSKNLIGAHIAKRYDVLLNSDDEYDAFAMYQMGLQAKELAQPHNQKQQEAVGVIYKKLFEPNTKKKTKGAKRGKQRKNLP